MSDTNDTAEMPVHRTADDLLDWAWTIICNSRAADDSTPKAAAGWDAAVSRFRVAYHKHLDERTVADIHAAETVVTAADDAGGVVRFFIGDTEHERLITAAMAAHRTSGQPVTVIHHRFGSQFSITIGRTAE